MRNPSPIVNRLARLLAFVLVTGAIWAAYGAWRPFGPILWLRHLEHLPPERNQVAITIDDAPHPLTTPLLLASLRRANVKASFFVIGNGLRLYPELTRRIIADGHALANHSHYHRNLKHVSPSEYHHEIDGCFAAIHTACGRFPQAQAIAAGRDTRLFRPPGGGLDRDVMDYLYGHNVTLAWWSNNVGDWARPPAWKVAQPVKRTLRPGDIVLLHDAGVGTPQAIPAIVKEAHERGLSFVPMPDSVIWSQGDKERGRQGEEVGK